MDLTLAVLIALIVLLSGHYLWKRLNKGLDVFEKDGVPSLKRVPIFGNTLPILMRKMTITDFILEVYNKFPGSKITGLFDNARPIYMIKDPELIKTIAVKDFEHFIDHQKFTNSDELFGQNLVNLSGQKWKDMRATLSPVFTGSKMRQMFDLLSVIAVNMGEYFKNATPDKRVVEMKDVFARFGLDVIASTNFGVQIDSMRQKENDFYKKVQGMLNFKSIWTTIRIAVIMLAPKVAKLLHICFIPKSKTKFFEDLIRDTEAERERQKIVRPDLINLMMQLKKGQLRTAADEAPEDIGFATVQEADLGKLSKRTWTEDELNAQAFVFFFGGFDTVSTAASFITYELAVNKPVQNKLIAEIDEVEAELNGKPLTYEVLQKMKYMDMVITEGLRFWSPADMTDRLCVKDYTLVDEETKKEVTIRKGSLVWIPISGLHFSSDYYDEPFKFKPERFSDENRANINAGAYLPFGVGPRNCIGSRFALMEVKAGIYSLLKNCTLETCEKTQIPLQIGKGFGKIAQDGIWLKIEPRKTK